MAMPHGMHETPHGIDFSFSLSCSQTEASDKGTMMPGARFSGLSHLWPYLSSHQIFSQVTMTSPRAASTAVLPESRDDTLYTAATLSACSVNGTGYTYTAGLAVRVRDEEHTAASFSACSTAI